MLAGRAELGRAGHGVDLLAHLAKGGIDAMALGLDILGNRMLDEDARLVIDDRSAGHSGDEFEALDVHGCGIAAGGSACRLIGKASAGDQLRKHHGDRLKRLDLDFVIGARIRMLNAEYADRALAAHDGHAGEAVEEFFARLRAIGEFGVSARLVQVEDRGFLGDRANQALAHGELGDVDGALIETEGSEELEHPLAQQVYGADFARHRFRDDLDDLVKLGLCIGAGGHDIVKAGEDLPG